MQRLATTVDPSFEKRTLVTGAVWPSRTWASKKILRMSTNFLLLLSSQVKKYQTNTIWCVTTNGTELSKFFVVDDVLVASWLATSSLNVRSKATPELVSWCDCLEREGFPRRELPVTPKETELSSPDKLLGSSTCCSGKPRRMKMWNTRISCSFTIWLTRTENTVAILTQCSQLIFSE